MKEELSDLERSLQHKESSPRVFLLPGVVKDSMISSLQIALDELDGARIGGGEPDWEDLQERLGSMVEVLQEDLKEVPHLCKELKEWTEGDRRRSYEISKLADGWMVELFLWRAISKEGYRVGPGVCKVEEVGDQLLDTAQSAMKQWRKAGLP